MRRLWIYWRENFEQAEGGYAMIALVLSSCSSLTSSWLSLFPGIETKIGEPSVLLACVAGVFFASAFIWMPFKRHETLLSEHGHKISEIKKQLNSYETNEHKKAVLDWFVTGFKNHIRDIERISSEDYSAEIEKHYEERVDWMVKQLYDQADYLSSIGAFYEPHPAEKDRRMACLMYLKKLLNNAEIALRRINRTNE